MRLTAACLAEWAKGHLFACDPNREVLGISTDSRTILPGQAFVALKGERCDGHDFIAEAMQKGAALAIVQRPEALANRPGIIVANSLQALGEIAHRFRWQQPLIPWVAVTGSNGKTTTRCMIAHLLRSRGSVAEPPANFNNLVGLPLTILKRPDDAWVGVLEMGTNAPGEIAQLTRIATPTIAVITSIGPAHLEGFGTVEAVAQEKSAIFERLPNDGLAIYPAQCLC
ncbi:MAG: UDP-N-acetylmuramoyl-tripeptide--D-alanyl-D-alanine ligase, partial [Planctomycetota bacterium]|nr:UDP-N-acetylmuramoyl-tripeptide--D-alanyl-D-alanine ligase [Planctomycetota bacterium]